MPEQPPSRPLPPADAAARYRLLPSVDQVLRRPGVVDLVAKHGRPLVTRAVRRVLELARGDIGRGAEPVVDDAAVATMVARVSGRSLRPVINATGVVLHTNLGRAPLAPAALAAAAEVGRGYSNLEYDLDEGRRGSRYVHASGVLRELLGVEDALVVNNGAAAVLLALSALASGREAVASRGELVEIGGGFRVPDVITQGGARLVEVGTTNRTRVADYERALGPQTAVLLKTHQGNFFMEGFTESVSVAELAVLGARHGVPVVVDLGTGLLSDAGAAAAGEPGVRRVVEEGADLVVFSGDKLLGGPQAGIIAGKRALVAACRSHPLCRALRVDKFTLAALESTLALHRDGRSDEIPAVRMLRTSVGDLRTRAEKLRAALSARGVSVEVVAVTSRPGGGTLPRGEIPSVALAVPEHAGRDVAAALRAAVPPVVARTEEGQLLLDLRTVHPDEDNDLANALAGVILEGGADSTREDVPC